MLKGFALGEIAHEIVYSGGERLYARMSSKPLGMHFALDTRRSQRPLRVTEAFGGRALRFLSTTCTFHHPIQLIARCSGQGIETLCFVEL